MEFIVIIFSCAFNLTIGSVCWIHIAEILLPSGLSVTAAINLFSRFILGLIFPLLISLFGGKNFYAFKIFNIIYSIFCYYCALETKGNIDLEIKKLFVNASTKTQKKFLT